MTPRRRALGLLVGLVAVVLLAVVGAAPTHAAEPPTTDTTSDPTSSAGATPTTEAATTVPAEPAVPGAGGGGVGDLDVGANTPSPRGEPAPPRAQRIADSAIAAGLLVVLAAGVVVAIWTARRGSDVDQPEGSSAGPGDHVGDGAGEAVGGPRRER